ncbi:hypothetical protein BG004_001233 [Podila humilis]|nr:hypothetical protein BG004_001233 [Podila humilis]
MRTALLSLAIIASTVLVASVDAGACDPAKCIHPACVCPSEKPPKGLAPNTVPQFFTLTFDDAIQGPTVPVADALMKGLVNPNGCPIKATWFAQTIYSDFALIQQWYAAGNEVADHTMTHVGTPPAEEIIGNRKAINAFSGIPFTKMTGFRAPFLNYSKGTFDILGQEKFQYDSSTNAVPTDAWWPYTLDYGLANDCWNGICDAGVAIPGMWEIPMHAIMDSDLPTAIPHAMDAQLDASSSAVSGWLNSNFDRHYNGNRQPFGIYLHPVHVGNATELYTSFFRSVLDKPLHDVWFVTNQQLLEWMKNPVPASELAKQDYMKCTQPAIGKEICNGIDDTKAGTIDSKVLETCNFVAGPWSTCYGCPKTAPTTADPVPVRVTAAGTPGYRTPVPATCAMEWWDPIAAQCLCTASNCTFTDGAIAPKDGVTTADGKSPSSAGTAVTAAASSWSGMAIVAAIAAGFAQML